MNVDLETIKDTYKPTYELYRLSQMLLLMQYYNKYFNIFFLSL